MPYTHFLFLLTSLFQNKPYRGGQGTLPPINEKRPTPPPSPPMKSKKMNHDDYSRQDLIDLVNRQSQIIYEMNQAINELEDDLDALTENYNSVLSAYEELRQEKTGRRY